MEKVNTLCQAQFDLLVKSGMDYTTEPIKSEYTDNFSLVVFEVTKEVAEKYYSLLRASVEALRVGSFE